MEYSHRLGGKVAFDSLPVHVTQSVHERLLHARNDLSLCSLSRVVHFAYKRRLLCQVDVEVLQQNQ
jgi:hypothetical protein